MKYNLTVKIIVKSYPRSGKAKIDNQSAIVDEDSLGNIINSYILLKKENGWESLEFEVHKL